MHQFHAFGFCYFIIALAYSLNVDSKYITRRVVNWYPENEIIKIHTSENYFKKEAITSKLKYSAAIPPGDQTFPWHFNQNPDIHLSTPELIKRYGYPAEIHKVTTDDGYILTVHRIPHGKNEDVSLFQNDITQSASARPVIFLQHGMFGTSADWVLNSQEKSLAYMLADIGYDVWLGNCRGNIYSQNHIKLSSKNIKFWKFSWHEMGVYDLPAVFNHILSTTGEPNLSYVGHSMGTTMLFVLLSMKPEYNSKINVMGALGPAVYLNHTTSAAKFFSKHYGWTERLILDKIGHGIFLPKYITRILQFVAPEICTEALKTDKLCEEAIFLLAGHDPAQTNYTQLPVILAHVPSTVSTQTGFHYFQIMKSGEFTMYDYKKENVGIYNSTQPPKYPLEKIDVPIGIFWGDNDIICTPVDIARLANKLPNVILNHRVDFPSFNHLDFVFAKNVDFLINKPLIQMLEPYRRGRELEAEELNNSIS